MVIIMQNVLKKLCLLGIAILLCMLSLTSCKLFHEHEFGEWVTTKAAACLNDGEQTRTCECGETETQVLPATGHSPGKESDCTTAQNCTVCNTELAAALGHTPGAAATCTTVQNCTVCNAELTAAKGHQPGEAATCTTAQSCTVCNAELAGALGHQPGEAATCTTAQNCTVCNAELIGALGHTEVIDPAVGATFSQSGLTQGSHCGVCNIVMVAQTEIPALGGDIVAGSDYYDDERETSYRYSYSLSVTEGEAFTLTTLTVGSDESFSVEYATGTMSTSDSLIFELVFDDKRDSMYIKIVDGCFEFCKKDGSPWDKPRYERPEGTTTVDITPRKGNSAYGYYDFANHPHGKDMQELYYRLYYSCEAFMRNTQDIDHIDGLYVIDTVNLDHYAMTLDEVLAVWKVFCVENPRYYWLSNTVIVSGGKLKLCISADYADADERFLCDAAIDQMTAQCGNMITEDMSDLAKALAIHDFIIGFMNYVYESDGVTPANDSWAHNIVGCARYGSGVCETYAKTYLYLCLINDVDCLIVTGYASENHAWNMICIDGVWYTVDCTWDDTGTDARSYDCFGMNKTYTEATHTADEPWNQGVKYWYRLPEISERSIELVDVYKDGVYIGVFVNIDEAFKAMTDQSGNYTVKLYSYWSKGPLLVASSDIVHRIYSKETPQINCLTVIGERMELENGFGQISTVVLIYDFSLNCDLIIESVNLNGKTCNVKDFSLTTAGYYCGLYISIVGNRGEENSSSELIINTTYETEIYGEINIHKLSQTVLGPTVVLRNHTWIDELHATTVSAFQTSVATDPFAFHIGHWYGGYNFHIYCGAEVNIQKISDPYLPTTLMIFFYFGKIEEFGTLVLDEINSPVSLVLNGEVHYEMTDLQGNVIDRWTEKASPFNITRAIAVLKDPSCFDQMQIQILGEHYWMNYTYLYKTSDTGELVMKEHEIKNDMLILDNWVVTYKGTAEEIVIPESMLGIRAHAFAEKETLKSVIISSGVTSIGALAFEGCENLESIVIPDSVMRIGERVFERCGNLSAIRYNGTIEQWNAIVLEWMWDYNLSAETVICSDGVISLK